MVGATHTAGPWAYDADSGEIYRDDKDTSPAIATMAGDWVSDDQNMANAHLIEAAPDLLVALEHLVFDCEAHGLTDNDAHLREARAAIAKAKGE